MFKIYWNGGVFLKKEKKEYKLAMIAGTVHKNKRKKNVESIVLVIFNLYTKFSVKIKYIYCFSYHSLFYVTVVGFLGVF